MKVTVFTTFYLPHLYIDAAITSVLAQTFKDFELLILNDGSPAESERIRREFPDPRIRILDQPRQGLVRSRQRGLIEAQGEYLALLDSDDIAEPLRLEKQVRFLEENPDYALTGASILVIDQNSRVTARRDYPSTDADIRRTMPVLNCIAQSAVTLRTAVARQVGGYRLDRFQFAEDYDLWLRMGQVGKFFSFKEPLVRYRIHPEAGKLNLTKKQLKDTLLVRAEAISNYGYPWSLKCFAVTCLQKMLLFLPASWIYGLFNAIFFKRNRVSSE